MINQATSVTQATPTNNLVLYKTPEEMLEALQEQDPQIEKIPGRTVSHHRYGV